MGGLPLWYGRAVVRGIGGVADCARLACWRDTSNIRSCGRHPRHKACQRRMNRRFHTGALVWIMIMTTTEAMMTTRAMRKRWSVNTILATDERKVNVRVAAGAHFASLCIILGSQHPARWRLGTQKQHRGRFADLSHAAYVVACGVPAFQAHAISSKLWPRA